jgi:uracil-DNA glycosylase family 4
MQATPSLSAAEAVIPADLLLQSGKVFYSGRNAFSTVAAMYVLGVNPGGDPTAQADETVGSHTSWVANMAPADWSAYRDEKWKGKPPGSHGMQPRILHMFKTLGVNPGEVPASNLVFVRSRREGDIAEDLESLANHCWPFHKYVIKNLRPKVVLCLGKTAGDYVRSQTGAHERYATFTEQNNRKWQSHAFRSRSGLRVIVATHPSIADWTAPASDPTALVVGALNDA